MSRLRRRGLAAAMAMLACATWALPLATAQAPDAASSPGVPAAVYLIHHPGADDVDPFGFLPDPFADRYAGLASTGGVFDYPTFIADGVLAVRAIPDPEAPFVSVRNAYVEALQARAATESPVRINATTSLEDNGRVAARVLVQPKAPLQENQGQDLVVWVALVEDNVFYRPPTPVSNGVDNHRFTVRAVHELAAINRTTATALTTTFATGPWATEQLSVAVWVQADASPGRFAAHEVVQALHVPLDATRSAETKVVLAQMYSATWCNPCLYGDRALEDIAIQSGAAEAARERREGYLHGIPVLAAAGLACGAALAAYATRRAA